MAIRRHKPETVVVAFGQGEVMIGQRMPGIGAIRQIGVTEPAYSR